MFFSEAKNDVPMSRCALCDPFVNVHADHFLNFFINLFFSLPAYSDNSK